MATDRIDVVDLVVDLVDVDLDVDLVDVDFDLVDVDLVDVVDAIQIFCFELTKFLKSRFDVLNNVN